MSELGRIAKEIEKKKNLELNLPKYMNTMHTLYHRFAYIHLALNYYTCGEMFVEEMELPDSLRKLAGRVHEIIQDGLLENLSADKLVAQVKEIDKIRTEIMEGVTLLTSYVDCLQIYEYVLNRVEYRFGDVVFPFRYNDSGFTQRMMQYILKDKDRMVMRTKVSQVIGQLPMRMTKQRFFEIVRENFSMYLGSEKSDLDDLLYMLRTCAAFDEPKQVPEGWEKIFNAYRRLKNTDYKEISEEEYETCREDLISATEYIHRINNMYQMLQEVVNDVYILLLSMPYALTETKELESCRTILRYVQEQIKSKRKDAFEGEEAEKLLESFEKLEGKQEQLYELFSENDYLLDSMDELMDTMKSIMVDKLYLSLKQIAKLASNSRYIELHKVRKTELVEEDYLDQVFRSFMEDMELSFKENVKIVNRARMAAVLQALPTFLRNMDECEMYIRQALMNCSDQTEKLACVELLMELMEQ